MKVGDGKVRFEFKEHYAEESDARKSIEEFIYTWEFDACLNNGIDSFRLEFEKAEIEDRNPTPGKVSLCPSVLTIAAPTVSVSLAISLPDYPYPPLGLLISSDVQTMYDRYMNYRRGRESLLGMAYFCLTIIEGKAKEHYAKGNSKKNKVNSREAASLYYGIEKEVLDKIGCLTSKKDGRAEARKNKGIERDLTHEDRSFLKQSVREIIRRAAEKAYSPDKELEEISLSDFFDTR